MGDSISTRRTTIRLYRGSTESGWQEAAQVGFDEPPYGSTEGALKVYLGGAFGVCAVEPPYGSTEGALKAFPDRKSGQTSFNEPPYGSTEGALKVEFAELRGDAELQEPPYGSTEGALKGRRVLAEETGAEEPPYGSTEGALKGPSP